MECVVPAQFGHLFAKGDTREAAIRAMVVALKEVKIRGEIRTTVDYCVEMIQSPDFVGNNIHTGWLDARIAAHVSGQLLSPTGCDDESFPRPAKPCAGRTGFSCILVSCKSLQHCCVCPYGIPKRQLTPQAISLA
jgi:hypothetical protein